MPEVERHVRFCRVPHAAILGGSGAIGQATARRLLKGGWSVTVLARDPTGFPQDLGLMANFVAGDRHDRGALATALAFGSDLVVDCACYTAAHARELIPFLADVGTVVMVSSSAVYVDAAGHHVNSAVPPVFDGPVTEAQPTLGPGQGDYDTGEGYGPNKVAAEFELLQSGYPVTVLRPGKVHGAAARRPREWLFVKRVLDHRPAVLLADGGRGVAQPTAAANVAALIEVVASQPGRRILNSADPDAPSALQIARVVAAHLGHEWIEVLLDGMPADLGEHPWRSAAPIVLSSTAASELGYKPVGDYAATVVDEIDWLFSVAAMPGGASLPPYLDRSYFSGWFDYAAEDRYLAALRQLGHGVES